MHRTNIYLEDRQVAALDARARRAGTTRADIIRGFVDRGLQDDERDLAADLAAIDASFGVAADVTGQRRGDDERERYLARVWRS